jgi:ABC-type multidrug transport system fused ATPase/permease subunit
VKGCLSTRFADAAQRYARTQSTGQVIGSLPHYALETVAFGGIILIVIYLLARGQEIGQALPLIGLYAFSAYRLMPALQQIFAGVTTIRFNMPALNLLHEELQGPDPVVQAQRSTLQALPFGRELVLEGVTFSYPDTERPAADDVTLRIDAYTSVAFVGHTGSGKTTLVDVILGLLAPQEGALRVDGVPLTPEKLPNW